MSLHLQKGIFDTETSSNDWLFFSRIDCPVHFRLVCFPPAGMGPVVFRGWAAELPAEREFVWRSAPWEDIAVSRTCDDIHSGACRGDNRRDRDDCRNFRSPFLAIAWVRFWRRELRVV